MSTQVYECPFHGEFDVHLSFADEIKELERCPYVDPRDACGQKSRHVIKPPGGLLFARTWNEKANEYQRDAYSQAKAQLTNMYNEQRDKGRHPTKPTEEAIQVAAQQIDRGSKVRQPGAEEKAVRAARKQARSMRQKRMV